MKRVFQIFAVGFVVSASVHIWAVAHGSTDRSPAWRHVLFVAIDLVAAIGMLQRPRWFAFPFAVLTVQQFASHGADLANAWRHEHRIDVVSLVVVLSMPLALALLVRDTTRDARPSA